MQLMNREQRREYFKYQDQRQPMGEFIIKINNAMSIPTRSAIREIVRDFYKEWYILENISFSWFDLRQQGSEYLKCVIHFNYTPIIKPWYIECLEFYFELA